MPNEAVISRNSLITFTSDYEYVLGEARGKVLQFSGRFLKTNFLKEQVEQIAYDLETTAKVFAQNQGLAPGDVGYDGKPNTGNLYNGIVADVRPSGNGWSARLRSLARNERGIYYGGHVEFGHFAGKGYVPARPHLRPALQAVSLDSRNKLGGFLADYFRGYMTNDTLSFSFRKGRGPTANFGRAYGGSPKYYRQGPGHTAKYLSTGTRGQRMRYHQYNIERFNSRAIHRAQGAYSVIRGHHNSASQQMGWLDRGRSLSPKAASDHSKALKMSRSNVRRAQSPTYRKARQASQRRARQESKPSGGKHTPMKTTSERRESLQQNTYKNANAYGKQSSYPSFKQFADDHGLSMSEAKPIWDSMRK